MKSVWILSKHDKNNYENKQLLTAFEQVGIDACLLKPTESILKKELPKFVLSRTGSGSNYANLSLLRTLESANVKVINSSNAIELVKDKLHTAQLLKKNKIPTPKTKHIVTPLDLKSIEEEIGFPCVVKAVVGSYGNGVHLCDTREDFVSLIEFITAAKSKRPLLVQEFIQTNPGTDLRAWVIGEEVIGVMQRKSTTDFRANISRGGIGSTYPITQEIRRLSKKIMQLFGLQLAGIDFLFDKQGLTVCEVNSAPGFEGMEQHCQIPVADMVAEYFKKLK